MSTWGRIALMAAGAAAGAVATRWAASEQGRQVVGELTQRVSDAGKGGSALERRGTGADVGRENRLASSLLRVAQDVKAAMDQRETELRDQLGIASPQQVRSRHTALSSRTDELHSGSSPSNPAVREDRRRPDLT
ncbi:hypothetical protein GWK18_00700 [Kocuria sp. JC486]|uniref:YtxH domain-containing protein n=1 Tax=Kocuria soli TaxID=2485125 RepID=A0A3N4A002_9MICC|nr:MULTISPECIES: hypothetical protein [Kocuria]NHU84133.1 hypothetical protein [Kocuria sp. JC486]ROZ64718.1 hypothetical protein EDL96_02455 [Kocuria soli]